MDLFADASGVEVGIQLVHVVFEDGVRVAVYPDGRHCSYAELVENINLFLVLAKIRLKSVHYLQNLFGLLEVVLDLANVNLIIAVASDIFFLMPGLRLDLGRVVEPVVYALSETLTFTSSSDGWISLARCIFFTVVRHGVAEIKSREF